MSLYKKVTHYLNIAVLVLICLSFLLILILGISSAKENTSWGKFFAGLFYFVGAYLVSFYLGDYCIAGMREENWKGAGICPTILASIAQVVAVVAIVFSNICAASNTNVWTNLFWSWLWMSIGFLLFVLGNRLFWKISIIDTMAKIDLEHRDDLKFTESKSTSSVSAGAEHRRSEEENLEEERAQREREKREYNEHFYHSATSVKVRRRSGVYSSPVLNMDVCDYDIDVTFTFKTASGRVQTKTAGFYIDCQPATSFYYSTKEAEGRFRYMLSDYYG